jgi:hypothetical protein
VREFEKTNPLEASSLPNMNPKNVVAITTLEDMQGSTGVNNGNMSDAIDLRSLNRGETLAGFDHRQFDFEDPLQK